MKTEPNDSSQPAMVSFRENGEQYNPQIGSETWQTSGLSKREHFAAIAMQGLLVNNNEGEYNRDEIAVFAVGYADALITALNK